MVKTLIVSAYPGCGKSYMYNHCNGEPYIMLDSDSSKFSWIYENGQKTDKRNPNFVKDYVKHIAKNFGRVDVIFISTHKEIREELIRIGLNFAVVIPELGMKDEWMKRLISRGTNDEAFYRFQEENYEKFIQEIQDQARQTNLDSLKCTEQLRVYNSGIVIPPPMCVLELTKDCPYIDNDVIYSLKLVTEAGSPGYFNSNLEALRHEALK